MFHHITVLKEETVAGLLVKPNGIYVDCTLGGAGHSEAICSQLGKDGLLIGIDQDAHALQAAEKRLASFNTNVKFVKSNFSHLKEVLTSLNIAAVYGIIFDLGVSSPQLDEAERGFSYNHDAPLDMRMDQLASLTAYEIINEWDEKEIMEILFKYGEEKFSRRIAQRIVEAREEGSIETTGQLVELIKNAIPAAARRTGPHPAKRSFQGIRIAVNDELNVFEKTLEDTIDVLKPEGRVAVITFHSLEDRICKKVFQSNSQGCTCPPSFPICNCNPSPKIKLVTRKPIVASNEELESNSRARSAKLRIAEKI
ncbi:MAG: 16S rRNA (cytosine(1402)-N(4))-methyltransferase RsmH [Bacilli bacterium]